jgi:uroporphyrinogen-III synthase
MLENTRTILSTGYLSPEIIGQYSSGRISIDVLSFTETVSSVSPFVEERIRALAAETATVVFTSANAVQAVITRLKHIPSWKIYCTSGPTRRLVESFFGSQAIAGTDDRAALIAAKMIADRVPQAVFFCGQQRLDELPTSLQEQGITLEECIVYTTTQTPQPLQKEYDAILFFSPAAVKSFFSVNRVLEETGLFALGATTAAAIREYSASPVLQSQSPEKNLLLKMALDHYSLNTIKVSDERTKK